MIKFKHKGNFSKATKYLVNVQKAVKPRLLEKFGEQGVAALSAATPVDSGLTSESWYYEIETKSGMSTIRFDNSNIQNGVAIAIILQYGHGTRNGGWVQGRDYINPAIQPIFDSITEEAWKEVTRL